MELQVLRERLEQWHEPAVAWARVCCRGDRSLGDKVLQTSYVKILQGKARFDDRAALRTWLFTVIRMTAYETIRRQATRRARMLDFAQKLLQQKAHDLPDVSLEQSDENQRVRTALQSLPTRQREVLHLVFFQELSIAGASEVMGIAIGSARKHYERGKAKLRLSLSPPSRSHSDHSHSDHSHNDHSHNDRVENESTRSEACPDPAAART